MNPSDPSGNLRFAEAPGLQNLPLFPLDMVLFPGMHVSLHIFEERYKAMIAYCLDTARPFGIVLPLPEQPDPHDVRKTRTHRIGCSARILAVDDLEAGEINIEIEGIERFKIIEQHEVAPYRTGIVEPFADVPMPTTQQPQADRLLTEVQTLLRDFLTRHLASQGRRIVEFDLPDDTGVLSFLAACVLPIANTDKQPLLETTNTLRRLETERVVLRRAIAQLRRQEARSGATQKVDLPRTHTATETLTYEPVSPDHYRDYRCGN